MAIHHEISVMDHAVFETRPKFLPSLVISNSQSIAKIELPHTSQMIKLDANCEKKKINKFDYGQKIELQSNFNRSASKNKMFVKGW